jgi:hypothetical protein
MSFCRAVRWTQTSAHFPIPRATLVLLAAACSLLITTLLPAAAHAHERREVGPYTFVVGFLTEPAIQGQPNGIDLRVTRTATGEPVEGAERTLKAAIAYGGGAPKEIPLRGRFNMPGSYAADVIPTKPGSYLFTFTGTIDGVSVNQRFESGPGRFNDVEAASRLQFPESIPEATSVVAAASAAEAQAARAQLIGLAGLGVGALGVALAAMALLTRRREIAPPAPKLVGAEHR